MQKLNRWQKLGVGLVAVGFLVTVVLVIGFSAGPKRAGDSGHCYWGPFFHYVYWRIPLDSEFSKERWKRGWLDNAGINPYALEIEDVEGRIYRKRFPVAVYCTGFYIDKLNSQPQEFKGDWYLILSFDGKLFIPAKLEAEKYLWTLGPERKDGGIIFNTDRDTPQKIRVTVADKYYFEWDRDEK